MTLTLGHFLSLGAILFALSVVGIFLNRIIGGNREQRSSGLCPLNVAQSVGGIAGSGIAMLTHHDHLQIV